MSPLCESGRIAIFMAKPANMLSTPKKLRVAVLAYEGCSAWVSTGLREAFELAHVLETAGKKEGTTAIIGAAWFSAGQRQVRASAGVQIDVPRWRGAPPDVLVVPPLWHSSFNGFVTLVATLEREISLISRLAREGVTIASVCSGVSLLAAAGLLEGRSATGCWWLEQPLRKMHPRVRWQFDDSLVRDGSVITAGSGSAYAALVFDLLERSAGRAIALQTARFIGFEPNRTRQASFSHMLPLAPSEDPLVARFERYIGANASRSDLDITLVAQHLNTSPRTLYRRVQSSRGLTPLRMVQRARLEQAKSQLCDTELCIEQICANCGWSDLSSFRKLFARDV
ncbi:MAG: helix-turn-helix domain-containing protein, partial [Ramlibacter sp.]